MIPAEAVAAIPDPNLAGTTGLLAFLSNRNGAWNLWTMTPTGTDLTQLTLSGGVDQPAELVAGRAADRVFGVRQRGLPGLCG